MKINGSYYTSKSSNYNQVRRLEDANTMGNMFIAIGDANYNITMIEKFWYEEINDEEIEQKPRKRKVSIEPIILEPYQGGRVK